MNGEGEVRPVQVGQGDAPSYATRAAAWSFLQQSGDIADLARRIIDYAHEHHIDLAYERQAFGERDIDMTKVNDIVDHVR